jgi:hypothetical protein
VKVTATLYKIYKTKSIDIQLKKNVLHFSPNFVSITHSL